MKRMLRLAGGVGASLAGSWRAMPENSATPDLVKPMREALEAFNRGDVDMLMSFFAADAVFESPVLGTRFEGVAGIRSFAEDWLGAFAEWTVEPEEIIDMGDGVVIAAYRQEGRPVASSGLVSSLAFLVCEWADTLLLRSTTYTDIDEARAAAERLAEERRKEVSKEDVHVVRRMYEAFNRGDFALARELLHPEAELHQPPEVPDADSYYGREEWERGFALWLSEWQDPRFEPQEITGTGRCVIMRVRVSGRGKASGIETATDFFHAWTLRDGQPQRCFVRWTREEAHKAVGLKKYPLSTNLDLVRSIYAEWARCQVKTEWMPSRRSPIIDAACAAAERLAQEPG
jgi:ketosteroid isomerase-like protein